MTILTNIVRNLFICKGTVGITTEYPINLLAKLSRSNVSFCECLTYIIPNT